MTTQLQHAVRIQSMVDQHLSKHKATGYNYTLRDWLRDECGFKVLGSGYFSIVIAHPENLDMVIKITAGCRSTERQHSGKGHLSDGYLDFVAAVMRGPKSKHLPEFHAAVSGQFCAVVVMRRYEKNDFDNPVHQSERNTAMKQQFLGFNIEHLGYTQDAGIAYIVSMFGDSNDLHSDNYMFDPDTGDVVITDPYSTRKGLVQHRVDRYLNVKGHVMIDVQVQDVPAIPFEDAALTDVFMHPIRRKHIPMVAFDQPIRRMVHHGPNIQQIKKRTVSDKRAHVDRTVADVIYVDELKALDNPQVVQDCIDALLRRGVPRHRIRVDRLAHKMKWKIWDDRAKVAEPREIADVRTEAKDRMLRIRAEHDHPAQPVRIQGTLLPRQDAQWVRPAREAELAGVGAAALRQLAHESAKLVGPAPRLLIIDTAA